MLLRNKKEFARIPDVQEVAMLFIGILLSEGMVE
jgi:hypothetical protein